MKEGEGDQRSGSIRSAVEKERTKLRERQRRSITTKIFHGLRKHGGYHLSPRADINEVLRHLAREAGWTVEPDGTTYRSSSSSSLSISSLVCSLCGAAGKSGTPTPTSSFAGGGGRECSTTASPSYITRAGGVPTAATTTGYSNSIVGHVLAAGPSGGTPVIAAPESPPVAAAMYMYGRSRGGSCAPHNICSAAAAANRPSSYVYFQDKEGGQDQVASEYSSWVPTTPYLTLTGRHNDMIAPQKLDAFCLIILYF